MAKLWQFSHFEHQARRHAPPYFVNLKFYLFYGAMNQATTVPILIRLF